MRDWLKEKRTQKNMTAGDMAKAVGISEGYYSRIESGERQRKMDIRLAMKLANVLGMSLQEIVDKEAGK